MARFALIRLPLVIRELRAQARSKSNFTLRSTVATLLSAPFVVMAFLWTVNQGRNIEFPNGFAFFSILSVLVFYCLIMVAPMITAGCLTSEKEAGTLPLLFLSCMRSVDIVAGKFASNFLRLLSLLLAGMPVFAVPVMLGGVSWDLMLGTFLAILALLIVCVSTAVLASAWFAKTNVASFFSLIYVSFLNFGVWILREIAVLEFSLNMPEGFLWISPAYVFHHQFDRFSGTGDLLMSAIVGFTFASIQALLFLALATWWLPRTIVQVPSEGIVKRKVRRFRKSLPAWGATGKLKDRNPLFWLERRKLLFVTVLIFGLLVFGGFMVAIFNFKQSSFAFIAMSFGVPLHILVALMVLGGCTREILKERRDRTLELLLCTPLDQKSIVWSKFKGVWLRYGLIYMAIGSPILFAMGLDLLSPSSRNSFPLFEGMIPFVEYIEDFFFFSLLVAVSIRFGFSSPSSGVALAKGIGFFMGCYVTAGSILILISLMRPSWGGGEELFYILEVAKIALEIGLTFLFMKTTVKNLREEFVFSSGAR